MDCDELQRRIESGGDVGGADATSHLRTCAACAAMVAASSRLPRAAAPTAGGPAWADLAAALEREERPAARARSWSTPRRIAVGLIAVAAVPLLVLVVTPRPDLGVYPRVRVAFEALAFAIAIAAAAVITLRPLHRPRHAVSSVVAAVLAVLVIVGIASLPAAHHDHAASLAGAGADRLRHAAACLVFGTLCAAPAWLALRWLARDGDRLGARAVVVAAASAVVGAAGTYLHCPIVHPVHLWLGHVTVLLLPGLWALVMARARASTRA